MSVARGVFEVAMRPREVSEAEGGGAVSRFVLDKGYRGDLVASGRGQMLSTMTATDGSAGYVAMELVEGVLAGERGSFVLQHFGIMNRGEPTLQVTIVPDSGTDGFVGITGELAIDVDADGTHRYTLTYEMTDTTLPGGS